MFYLGQVVLVKDSGIPGIYLGTTDEGCNHNNCWVYHLYDRDYLESNGVDTDEGDVFLYTTSDLDVIKDSSKSYKELSNLPISQCIYKGPYTTHRLSGDLPDSFISEREEEINTFLRNLENKKCFVIF